MNTLFGTPSNTVIHINDVNDILDINGIIDVNDVNESGNLSYNVNRKPPLLLNHTNNLFNSLSNHIFNTTFDDDPIVKPP